MPISSFKAQHQDLKIPSSYVREEATPRQQELPEKPRLFRTPIATKKPSNYSRIFWAY
jgi:hypothetical protein